MQCCASWFSMFSATDIKLTPEVKERGGLAIIGTERHESRRVDRQLRGRAGRQGDPGSSQFFVSLEDKLMRLFDSDRIASMMDKMGLQEGEVIQAGMMTKAIERAQTKVELGGAFIRRVAEAQLRALEVFVHSLQALMQAAQAQPAHACAHSAHDGDDKPEGVGGQIL